jgi:hypothetical protein
MVTFKEGLKFPWEKPKRLWNILWILVPIIGWFALMGYFVKIVQNLNRGNTKEIPKMDKFWDKFVLGFLVFVKMIPFMVLLGVVSWILQLIPVAGMVVYGFIAIFIVPYLVLNLMVTEKFSAIWEFERAVKTVFGNFRKYVIAFLMTLFYAAIYLLLSIVLVGIPCLAFGKEFYLVDFYRTAKMRKF